MMIVLLHLRKKLVNARQSGREVLCQVKLSVGSLHAGSQGSLLISDIHTPVRSPSEPWYLARHDFHPRPLLRPVEIRAYKLLLRLDAPDKSDILQLFNTMPRSHLRQSPAGPFLVSGVSPRSPDTGLTHSSEMPFMSMAVYKYMAKQCPSHLYSTCVSRRGVVDHVQRLPQRTHAQLHCNLD